MTDSKKPAARINKPISTIDLIEKAIKRLELQQEGKGKCRENRKALNRLKDARDFLNLKKG